MSATPFLYQFMQGANVYTYTGAEFDITHGGRTYLAVPIGHGDVEVGDEINRADLSVRIARDNEIALQYFLQVNEYITTLTVFKLESGGTVSAFWKGRITSYKPNGDEVELLCESVFTSLRRPGLRAKYQRGCRHTVYSNACGVSKDAFALAGNVSVNGGLTLTIPAVATKADGYFSGGMILLPDGSYRYLLNHTGAQVTLQRAAPSLTASIAGGQTAVTLYPGCDRTRQTCIDKFANWLNNGGFAWIPERNPYDGESLA